MSSKCEALADYTRAVAEIRAECLRHGMTKSEIDDLISSSFDAVIIDDQPKQETHPHHWNKVFSWILKVLLLATVLYAIVACHSPTQKTLSRHIQPFIYPFMRGLRKLTLPILSAYPDLTEWHEEPCLVRNPFYGMYGPECWPCDGVRSVLVLDTPPNNFADTYYHSGQPFVIQGGGVEVTWSQLVKLHAENIDLLHRPSPRIIAENFVTSSLRLSELVTVPEKNFTQIHTKSHLTWKITRSDAARALRQLFPRPQFVPGYTEVAIQRFVFVDSPQSPAYALPMTDFANVWVCQGSGSRLIALSPSPHCEHSCHPVSVLLHPGDLLFYNWQFWRPRSLPIQETTNLSITFVGSFY